MMRPNYGPAEAVSLPARLASAGIDYPLPGGEITLIEALCFTLTTSGGVANRQVIARLQDAVGADVYAVAAPGLQTATQTVVYSFAPLVPVFGSAALGFMGGPFPEAGYADNLTLVVTVVAADAADVFSKARLLVRQWEREPHGNGDEDE